MYETYMVNGKSKDALTHRFQCRSFTNANTREKVEDICHCIKKNISTCSIFPTSTINFAYLS